LFKVRRRFRSREACTAVDIPPENVVASHRRRVVPARSATVTAVSKLPVASRSGKVVLATRQQQADAATNVRGLSGRR
jgi:hypothetical protein